MQQFVSLALSVAEKMEIYDKNGRSLLMRFCRMYSPNKITQITERAKTYPWWQRCPDKAFMKAVGEINREELKNK
jgi:hypothetical protein